MNLERHGDTGCSQYLRVWVLSRVQGAASTETQEAHPRPPLLHCGGAVWWLPTGKIQHRTHIEGMKEGC